MHCSYSVYMSTQYDNLLCCWLVPKPIVRPSDIPHLQTLQLVCYCSYHIRIPVASELAHWVVYSPYLLLSNVNEPVSLSVWIINFSCLSIFHYVYILFYISHTASFSPYYIIIAVSYFTISCWCHVHALHMYLYIPTSIPCLTFLGYICYRLYFWTYTGSTGM